MTDLTADEQTVADAIKRSGLTDWSPVAHTALAHIAVTALDLPARDARVRAEVAEEIAAHIEASWGYDEAADIAREHATAQTEAPGGGAPLEATP